ncbi:hypothetical protein EV356DRAFT_509805 [Viridothelium virens]|uniref:Zn(2)-C6 fungal-type domain-containing protein n=1 Tax=Viridothelium virens TaxID=1048519 RepID=A0A6A6HJ91_VIRVR|nr:hypothetical protein EV356DRAFT_509805 [Viridothelium virens]
MAFELSHQPPTYVPPSGPAIIGDGTAQPPDHDTTSQNATSLKSKKRPSKTKTPAAIKRSASTPHMRSLAQSESGAVSPTSGKERARNKLGYQRTSVACGHCRRRKIRCLLAPDDPQGRCSNCIRLKKECNFYPVDQQVPTGSGAPSSSKGDTGSSGANTSTPSPKTLQTASIGDHSDDYNRYSPFTTNPPQGYAIAPGISRAPEAPLSAGGYAFHHGAPDPRYGWHEPEYAPHSAVTESPHVDGPASNYWRLNEQPIAPNTQYPKRPEGSSEQTPMPGSAHHLPWGPPPTESGYPPPQRSLSFPAIENLSIPGNMAPYPVQSPQDPRRPSNYSYTSVDHGSTGSSISIPGSNPSSMGPPAPVQTPTHSTPTHSQFPYKQQWSPYPPPPLRQSSLPSHSEGYGPQWYGEPAHLGHVAEEPPHSAPPFNLGPQNYFTGTNHSHGP